MEQNLAEAVVDWSEVEQAHNTLLQSARQLIIDQQYSSSPFHSAPRITDTETISYDNCYWMCHSDDDDDDNCSEVNSTPQPIQIEAQQQSPIHNVNQPPQNAEEHDKTRPYCGSTCKTCKGCICKQKKLPCVPGKCKCATVNCLNKPSSSPFKDWKIGDTFQKPQIIETSSGPQNIEKLSLEESANLIWHDTILEHVHERTNWKNQYTIDYSDELERWDVWYKAQQTAFRQSKTKRRKFNHVKGGETDISFNDEQTTTRVGKEPKIISFEQYLLSKKDQPVPKYFTKDEIRVFFQIILIMTLNPISDYTKYWTTDGIDKSIYGKSLIQKLMSRSRFCDIKKFISNDTHFIEDTINRLSRKYWICVREVSVDEIMEAFKGKVRFKQYMPAKPHKYGLKYYALSDSTGYIYAIWLYQGTESRHTHTPSAIVLDLLAHLQPTNHILGIDNYYGSLDLAQQLVQKNWKFVMTVRNNRPSWLFADGLQSQLKKKGDWVHSVHNSGNLVAISMNDNKRVNFLTNLASNEMVKNKPLVQDFYNRSMGGVDKSGIFLHTHQHPFRMKNWKLVDLIHNMKVAFTNQYIIFKNLSNKPSLTFINYITMTLKETFIFRNPYFDRYSHAPVPINEHCKHCNELGHKCTNCKSEITLWI